jgi:hypothetical protein
MEFDEAIKTINKLLSKKQPPYFNSSWKKIFDLRNKFYRRYGEKYIGSGTGNKIALTYLKNSVILVLIIR